MQTITDAQLLMLDTLDEKGMDMEQKSKTVLQSVTWVKVGHGIAIALKRMFQIVIFDVLVPSVFWVAGTISYGFLRAVKRYRRWWRITQRAYRFYMFGQIIFLIGMVVQALMKGASWPMTILFIGAVMFLFGFIFWVHPIVQKAITSEVGKWAYRIAHGFFAIFAIVIARAIVNDALQLPSQYFDVTVALVALMTYVPVWLGAIALFLAILVIGMYIAWAIEGFAQFLANAMLVPIIGHPQWFKRAQRKSKMRGNKRYLHTVGLFAALFFIASLFDGFGYATQHSLRGIRWFAYFADFQVAENYPGVPCEGRIRLMDNGIVAVAKIIGYDVDIGRINFKTEPDPLHGCIAKGSSR